MWDRLTGRGKLETCLGKLLPHLDRDQVAMTGGVAIDLALHGSGVRSISDHVADLDFVATSRQSVAQGIVKDFLVCHYHAPQPGYPKFLIMLVDPDSRLRVDIFPDLVGALKRATRITLGRENLLMLDPDSILEHKLLTLARASETNPADPKHYRHALALARRSGRPIPRVPAAHLAVDVYSTDLRAPCRRCEFSRDPAFSLAPKREIFELLGYV